MGTRWVNECAPSQALADARSDHYACSPGDAIVERCLIAIDYSHTFASAYPTILSHPISYLRLPTEHPWLLLGRRGLVGSSLDDTGSDLLAHLVELAHEAVFAGGVGLAVPFLVVPNSQPRCSVCPKR